MARGVRASPYYAFLSLACVHLQLSLPVHKLGPHVLSSRTFLAAKLELTVALLLIAPLFLPASSPLQQSAQLQATGFTVFYAVVVVSQLAVELWSAPTYFSADRASPPAFATTPPSVDYCALSYEPSKGLQRNMPRSTLPAALALLALLQCSEATAEPDTKTVWASVVFARSGEHTTSANILAPSQLTPLGANQAYSVGTLLHNYYFFDSPIPGLNTSIVDSTQIYILATDESQFGPASATAILQGLYPPTNNSNSLPSDGTMDPSGNIQNPLNGYQYPWIHTAGFSDPDSVWVNGAEYCPTWNAYQNVFDEIAANSQTEADTIQLYTKAGELLGNEEVPQQDYGYWNAYRVYEQVNYLYKHDTNAYNLLNSGPLADMDAYNRLRYLADEFQWDLYGDLTQSVNPISTIAGESLASKVIELLNANIGSMGLQNKLSILVGEASPLISFFALASLEAVSQNFTGMPQWGSIASFELISDPDVTLSEDINGNKFPYLDDLYVRFIFRNGTDAPLLYYGMFNKGEPELQWTEFLTLMNDIAISGITEWCGACDAWSTNPFCLFYNTTAQNAVLGLGPGLDQFPGVITSVAPVVAGIIGACVTFGVLGLLVALAILLCGLRFSLANKAPKEGAGGFKGSQKMASDADLTALKGAASAIVDEQGTKERVGSWELKQKRAAAEGCDGSLQPGDGAQVGRPLSFVSSIRRSFDTHDPEQNPFQTPVKPDERV